MVSPGERLPLSVLVPTYNEERNLAACLESVRWADEILVVDSFSTDRTREIARRFTDRVLEHEYVHSAAQKNWALPQTRHPWVLIVDADEQVTPELATEIQSLLAAGPAATAYDIRRVNHFLGRRIRHGGWEADRVIRLFNRDRHRYDERRVHAEIETTGPVPRLAHPLIHDTFPTFDTYFRKLDAYTRRSAEDRHQQGRRATVWRLLGHPIWRFCKMYLLRRGFLDGARGLILAVLSAFYVFLKYARLWELQHAPRGGRRTGDPAPPPE